MKRKFTYWSRKICLAMMLYGIWFSADARSTPTLATVTTAGTDSTVPAKPITGRVIADTGEGLPGVSVSVKGTTIGTITDANGDFKLEAPDGAEVLVFSYVGFVTEEISIENKSVINITMTPDVTQLQELVVVGYGTQDKRDVTGAISSVSSKDIEVRQPVDVFEALQGSIAGVQINTDPAPGGEPSIRIRGTSTLEGGVAPLYVVDGVPMESIGVINPKDIQSIEVLKDAASAAIYGSRSANGVVIVTTKRGKEGKPQISLQYNTMLSTLAHKLPQATADDRRLYQQKGSGSASLPNLPADSLNPAFNADNDLQEMLTRTAVRHQVDFSISGANDRLNYYTSVGYLADEGIILNSWANIARARINVEYRASDRITYGNRINFSYGKKNFINEGRVLLQAMQRPATFQIYFPDGTFAPTLGGRRNPLAFAKLQIDEYQNSDVNIYNYLTFKITDHLKLTSDFNIRGSYEEHLEFTPKIIEGTNGGYGNAFNTYWMQQNYVNYDQQFGDHSVSAVLGMSLEKWIDRNIQISGNNYVSESVLTSNSMQIITESANSESRHTLAGFFGRIGYDYKGKYIASATLRRDGSSRFGTANRWGMYPSASVGWRFSDEPFMKWSQGILQDGKFRASYGETGNERVGNYDALELYTFERQNFYNGVLGVIPSTRLSNPELGWESTKQLNIGMDLSFVNNRVSLVADYFKKRTDDLLYDAPVSSELGYTSTKVNFGSIQNEGFEFTINAFPVRNGQLTWNVSYFMAFIENTALKLYGGVPLTPDNRWLINEGGRLGDFYGWKTQGVYAYDESNAYTADWALLEPVFEGGVFTGTYLLNGQVYTGEVHQLEIPGGIVLGGGDMMWYNANGSDNVIDDKDKIVLGNAQPKFTAGLYNQIDYKGFSLSFNIYVQWGNKIYDRGRWDAGRFNGSNPTPDKLLIQQAWQYPGDITNVPKVPQASNRRNMQELNSLFVEDGSFIRLRNAKLSYQVPQSLASKLRMRNLSAFIYGNNLLTWTNYFWYDPEIPLGSPLRMGQDNGRSPRSRQVGLGINANF